VFAKVPVPLQVGEVGVPAAAVCHSALVRRRLPAFAQASAASYHVTLIAGETWSDGLVKELTAHVRKEIGPIASPDRRASCRMSPVKYRAAPTASEAATYVVRPGDKVQLARTDLTCTFVKDASATLSEPMKSDSPSSSSAGSD